MLKLLIVDDEEIISNTIANLIEWNKYDVKLIGTCKDGVEAYHTILDESPDIVLTDIRMPGISGLELIERINSSNASTNFIILSGYSEFDYAKRAMKCGVKHYLLKPCDENQIINCIKEIVEESNKISVNDNFYSSINLQYELTINMIKQGLSLSKLNNDFFALYNNFFNRKNLSYQYSCFYFLEQHNVAQALELISNYFSKVVPNLKLHKIYVHNVLIIFYPNFDLDYEKMDNYFAGMVFEKQSTSIQYERKNYINLKSLMEVIIQKLKRYEVIYFTNENQLLPYLNHGGILQKINILIPEFFSENESSKKIAFNATREILDTISSIDFLIQITDYIMLAFVTQSNRYTFTDVEDFFEKIHSETNIEVIRKNTVNKIEELLIKQEDRVQYSAFIEKLITYINENLSDSNLTLKYICENHLFMNVNYVSRCFLKETNKKFSTYLMNLRVQKAKEIFSTKDIEKIQNVAVLVGCGNNPYYFSKIFKKCTNMTPSAYIKKINSK